MRKLILFALMITLSLSAGAQAQTPTNLPTPCLGDTPNVYLIINAARRRIVNWDTFLSLGYQQAQIVPCGAATNDPEGTPITRLFKGSGAPVYWLKDGVRHYIPDMDTFTTLGFRVDQITQLPDDVMTLWPPGDTLDSIDGNSINKIYFEQTISNYTIRLWHPGQGLTDFATISTQDRKDVLIQDVESIGKLPASDITGDGSPDIEFLIRSNPGSEHCCWGMVVYSLDADEANKVLEVYSPGDQIAGTGQGDWQDLNNDGVYEFITQDPLTGIACSQPNVTAILEYDPAQQRYVGASPKFEAYYGDLIAQDLTQAKSGEPCDVYPLITTLLYVGKSAEAKSIFDSMYHAADAATFWTSLQSSVAQGRFYTAGS